MSTKDLEAIVRELADREAIRDLACRYADCVWRKDTAAVVDLFAEDGVMDSGLEPPIKGREALLAAFHRMIDDADFQPFVHNHVIELAGDRAEGRCYIDLRSTVEGKSMIGSGYYEDGYVRTDGQWRFASRKVVLRFYVALHRGWAESAAGED